MEWTRSNNNNDVRLAISINTRLLDVSTIRLPEMGKRVFTIVSRFDFPCSLKNPTVDGNGCPVRSVTWARYRSPNELLFTRSVKMQLRRSDDDRRPIFSDFSVPPPPSHHFTTTRRDRPLYERRPRRNIYPRIGPPTRSNSYDRRVGAYETKERRTGACLSVRVGARTGAGKAVVLAPLI